MNRTIHVVRSIAGVLWLVQLALGIVFWTGHALSLAQLHMGLGLLFVLALVVLAVLSARAGAPTPLVVAAVVLSAAILALGYTQVQILPGPYHWTVRVAHLLLGLAAMPLAGRLSMSTGGARPGPTGPALHAGPGLAGSRR
jgi:hypothetical protein